MKGNMKKTVNDLGVAAYLMMHGHKVVGRKSKNVFFEVADKDIEEFEKLSFEYLSSTYHQFDACIMSLKKIGEYDPNTRD